MVFSVDPEHGNDGNAVLRGGAASELDGRYCFEKGEERAPECAGLLSGDNGQRCGIGKPPRGFAGGRGGAATLLLSADRGRDRRAVPRMRPHAGNCGAPRVGRGRIARIQRIDVFVVECVLTDERTHPSEPPHVDSSGRGAAGRIGGCGRCGSHRRYWLG
jgi:hypothetical protein